MQKVLILLAAADEDGLTDAGQTLLRDFKISYQLRVGSAMTATDYVTGIIGSFQKEGGQAIICVTTPTDHLASLAAASSTLPVLQVLVGSEAIAWEPGPLPLANLGTGAAGFTKAVFFALQLLGLQDAELAQNLLRYRHSLAARVIAADQKNRITFDV